MNSLRLTSHFSITFIFTHFCLSTSCLVVSIQVNLFFPVALSVYLSSYLFIYLSINLSFSYSLTLVNSTPFPHNLLMPGWLSIISSSFPICFVIEFVFLFSILFPVFFLLCNLFFVWKNFSLLTTNAPLLCL